MEQIKIGTCIPGQQAEQWLPGMKDKGFECFAINFHMTYSGIDLKELAPKVMGMLEGTGTYVSTVGYYCNALQNESQLHDLEYAIDNAHLFGAKTVATFAGALEGQSIDAAIPRFKEVFSELAKRAEDRGVKLAIENCPMHGDLAARHLQYRHQPRRMGADVRRGSLRRTGSGMGACPSADPADRPHRPAAGVGREDRPSPRQGHLGGLGRAFGEQGISCGLGLRARALRPASATPTGGTCSPSCTANGVRGRRLHRRVPRSGIRRRVGNDQPDARAQVRLLRWRFSGETPGM